MKKIIAIACLFLFAVIAFAYCNEATAFKSGEYQDAERNVKVCVYEAFGKNYTYAVASYKMCPYSIKVCTNY